jgi:hypothetical protein
MGKVKGNWTLEKNNFFPLMASMKDVQAPKETPDPPKKDVLGFFNPDSKS